VKYAVHEIMLPQVATWFGCAILLALFLISLLVWWKKHNMKC
jgi:hypothetical protein